MFLLESVRNMDGNCHMSCIHRSVFMTLLGCQFIRSQCFEQYAAFVGYGTLGLCASWFQGLVKDTVIF